MVFGLAFKQIISERIALGELPLYLIIVVRLAIDEYSRTIAQKSKRPSLYYYSVAYNPPNESLQTILCDFLGFTPQQSLGTYPTKFSGIRPAYAWERTPYNDFSLGTYPSWLNSAWERIPHDQMSLAWERAPHDQIQLGNVPLMIK